LVPLWYTGDREAKVSYVFEDILDVSCSAVFPGHIIFCQNAEAVAATFEK